tara:strand:+ start:5638 stop:6429 length:792 start_codon:yes stop_codon:yes gene_type:complete
LTNDKRQAAGRPEGGQFAAHQRAEGLVTLSPIPTNTDRLSGLRNAATELEMRAGFDDIAAHTRALFPGSTGIRLRRSAFGEWWFSNVVGPNGPMTEGDNKFATEDPAMYELDDVVQPVLDKLGRSNQPFELGLVDDNMVMHFEIEPDGDDIARRLADVEASMRSLNDARDELRKDAVAAAVRADYPTGARVELKSHEYDDGGEYFTAYGIRDRDNRMLWSRDTSAADEFAENRHLHGLVRDLNPATLDWEWVDHSRGITIFDL